VTHPSAKADVSDGIRDVGPDVRKGKVELSTSDPGKFESFQNERQSHAKAVGPTGTGGAQVGDVKTWVVLDAVANTYRLVPYVLQVIGTRIEVWVEQDTQFPAGDCRNATGLATVTQAQAQAMADEFENNILPKESGEFSVAPARDGSNPNPALEAPAGYYAGDGNTTIALVGNVRDANYLDPTTPAGATYIAGFFSAQVNSFFDRNVMTIDSWDWLHRTGANPPGEVPPDGTANICSSDQKARPRNYEGVFAHEYQHLLHYYTDPGEDTWLNEGLSDYAQTLVGYVNTTIPYGQVGADGHITCFQGFYGSAAFPYCGAENSLTRWSDQGAPSILSDYGAAYTFITYLADHFGSGVVKYLHTNKDNGLASLQNYLDDYAPGLKSTDVVHDWLAQMALDRLVDNGAKGLTRDQKKRFTSSQLNSAIDWAWTGSYDSPGAPTNGGDFVLGIAGRPVNASTIRSMSFRGGKTYAPDPLEWTIDDNALYAGTGNNLDRAAVYDVSVPAGSPGLSFSARYNIERGRDFAVVQVSTDRGKTFTTLANENTTGAHAAGAAGDIVAELPGFTGVLADYTTERFDLSAYAGKQIKLSFRYLTDGTSNGNNDGSGSGWWIRDVEVDDALVSTGATLDGAKSASEVSPPAVAGWSVQAVGWSLDGKRVRYHDLSLDKNNAASATRSQLRKWFAGTDRIGFIVSADDPDETATENASYRLRVNGVRQPGGGGDTLTTTGTAKTAKRLPVSERTPHLGILRPVLRSGPAAVPVGRASISACQRRICEYHLRQAVVVDLTVLLRRALGT
jgi:hypothetical protein